MLAAGGGSILFFDGTRFRVGPQSAGADPGPACYGKAGPLTITDCNLVLGKIHPAFFPSVFGSDGYPGWKPNLNSDILKVAKSTYQQLYGKEPAVKAIHAGLECGIIGERMSGMDMISFGPTLEGVHSPDEKIYIDTVEKYWNFLLAILRNVN